MKSLMKLQLKTVFTSPVPYLFTFILFPLLYLMCASFLPAATIMPGIIATIICASTFFVFGTSLMQLKTSIVYKRLEANGLSRGKFLLSNGIISVLFSIISVYFFIEFFGTITAIGNWDVLFLNEDEFNKWSNLDSESTNLFIPIQFDLFFVNDLFSTLDDSVYLILLNTLSNVSDFNILIDVIEAWISDEFPNPGLISDIDQIGDRILEVVLAVVLAVDTHGVEYLYNQFLENGAPVSIITGILLPFPTETRPDGTFYSDSGTILFNTVPIYRFKFVYDGTNHQFAQMFLYSHFAPTLATLLSPIFGWSTMFEYSNNYEFVMLITFWIRYFILIFALSILTYSLMVVFVSASNNFEQYMIFSGLAIIAVMLCSGLFLPLVWILSTPMLFTMISLMPTTPIVFEIVHAWRPIGELYYPTLQTPNLLWSFGYPILVVTLLTIISSRLMTNENGKLTTKFEHDKKSSVSSKINVVSSLILIIVFLITYYKLSSERSMNMDQVGNNDLYPSNLKMFLVISLLVFYSLMLFLNIVNLQGKSGTLFKHRKSFSILNAFVLFPIGIATAFMTMTGLQYEKGSKNDFEFENED